MCQKPAVEGGETPIADSRRVFDDLPPAVRDELMQRGLCYVRNYGPHLDLPWQQVFGTDQPSEVERYCTTHGITWHWKPSGELRTEQRLPAAIRHPRTGAWVWFNQAHLFHVSSLPEPTLNSLLAAVGESELPRNVYYGDGGRIEPAVLEAVREVYRRHTRTFAWQAGDVLMLDNLLVAHGRSPFRGERRVVVVMA